MGHRGRKHDPLYRSRRLLTRADERLHDHGRSKLLGLLDAGDPRGDVRIKRIKRVAFGLTRFRNHRVRVLLYAGRPNWDLLATIRPR